MGKIHADKTEGKNTINKWIIIMEKPKETALFYNKIEKTYEELLNELMQKDCQRVEFIRGMLSVYSEILKDKKHWQTERINYFK
jgi:hypothetical protein